MNSRETDVSSLCYMANDCMINNACPVTKYQTLYHIKCVQWKPGNSKKV